MSEYEQNTLFFNERSQNKQQRKMWDKKISYFENVSFVLLYTYCRFSCIVGPETSIFLKTHNNPFQEGKVSKLYIFFNSS